MVSSESSIPTSLVTECSLDQTSSRPWQLFLPRMCASLRPGGVSSLDDIKRLRDAGEPRLDSVIVGKALYEGKFKLEEAIRPRVNHMSEIIFADGILKDRVAFVTGGGTGITVALRVRLRKRVRVSRL